MSRLLTLLLLSTLCFCTVMSSLPLLVSEQVNETSVVAAEDVNSTTVPAEGKKTLEDVLVLIQQDVDFLVSHFGTPRRVLPSIKDNTESNE